MYLIVITILSYLAKLVERRMNRGSIDKKIKIKVDKLRKCFGDLEVLKDISTEITEGEVLVILGPSASGKSTFLRV